MLALRPRPAPGRSRLGEAGQDVAVRGVMGQGLGRLIFKFAQHALALLCRASQGLLSGWSPCRYRENRMF